MDNSSKKRKFRSESQRRDSRRSSPPPPGAPPPSTDGPSDEAGAAGRLSDPTSLRVEDAKRLRDELASVLSRYEAGDTPRARIDGMTAACALCADPAAVLQGMIDALDLALKQAEAGGGTQ